jgi:hypothetical protein
LTLDTGSQVFYLALDMLDNPGQLYRTSSETIRAILNRTFFTRLNVDARKVTDAELKEPFNALQDGYHAYQSGRWASRTNERPSHEGAPLDRTTVVDVLASVLGQQFEYGDSGRPYSI